MPSTVAELPPKLAGDTERTPRPRLLVFELRLMGDAVMSLPFVRAAQAHYEVHVCCSPAAEPIFRMALAREQVHGWRPPWLDERHARVTPLAGLRAIRAMALQLAELRATHAVSAWCDPRTGVLMSLTGVRSRIGFPAHSANFYGRHLPWRQRQLTLARVAEFIAQLALLRPLLTQRLYRRDFAQHHVEDWRQIADVLGLALSSSRPALHVDAHSVPVTLSVASKIAPGADASLQSQRRLRIAIHPGASGAQKRWPLQHFVTLGHALAERHQVCFIEPPELALDSAVRAHFPVITTGSLDELASRLTEFDILLANDAGVAHLADALGLPVITIFLSSEPGHFAPFASRDYVISFEGACDVRPCFGRCTKSELLCFVPASYDVVAARVTATLARLFD